MATLKAASFVQRSQSAVTAVTTARQEFFEQSCFRSSSLALRNQKLQGLMSRLHSLAPSGGLPNEPVRRTATGITRSGLKELLTREESMQVKETLEIYIHEIRSNDPSDKNATLKVASLPANTAPLEWGSSFVFDNEVREGAGKDSKLLGRERGYGIVTDKTSADALQLTSKITFNENSKYKGSTLTFSGNVGGQATPYELIIHGGTGHFRGARGYVLADNAPNDGPRFIFKWNVFINH